MALFFYILLVMVVTYRNAEIHFSEEGTGHPIVLLHGFLESKNIWKSLSGKLSEKQRVISIDLPGHGDSGCFAETHTMEEMAQAVRVVLKQLEIQVADFLGHSMGGYVALAYLEQYPEQVNRLLLANSTPAADSPERKANRDRAIEVVNKNKSAFVSMAISNLLTPENNRKFKEELEKLKEEAQKFPEAGITAALNGMKIRTDRSDLLESFPGAKYLLAGKEDPILNYTDTQLVAEKCKCKLQSFTGGHLSYIENKKEFEKFVYFIE